MASNENKAAFDDAMKYFQASQAIIDNRKPTRIEKMAITALEPSQMVEIIGTNANEMEVLKQNFKRLVPDFGNKLVEGQGSFSLNLCAHILYTAGPRKKGDKTERSDKYWEYEIMNEDLKTDFGSYPSFFVYSFMSEEHALNIPSSAFSLKKASLLMVETLDTVVDYLEVKFPYTNNLEADKLAQEKHAILTPLAAAAFSKQTVIKLAEHATKREAGGNGTVAHWCKMINASCAGGGHLLENSNGTIAAAASMYATKNLGDKKLAESIVGKVVKQYAAAGKPFDDAYIGDMLRLVNGGWPTGWSYSKLVETQDKVKELTPMDAAKIQALTAKMAYPIAPNTKTSK